MCLLALDLHDKAIECFDAEIRTNPQDPEPYAFKAAALYDLTRLEEAIQYFDEAARLGYDDPEMHHTKGLAHCFLNHDKEAVECFEAAAKLDPEDIESLYYAALSLSSMGRYNKAIKYFDNAAKLDPSSSLAYSGKGDALLGLRKYDSALKCYDQALKIDPADGRCMTGKGAAYSLLRRYDRALDWFSKAAEAKPGMESRFLMGKTLEELGRSKEALAQYDSAIEADSGKPFSYLPRAQLLEKMGHHDEALECYDQAIKILEDFMDDAGGSDAHSDRDGANPEFPARDRPRRKGTLEEYGCSPDSDTSVWNDGSLISKIDGGAEHGALLQLEPSNALVYVSKAQLLEQLGRRAEAEECYAKYESACAWYRSKPHLAFESWLVFAPKLSGLKPSPDSWYLYALPSKGVFQHCSVLPFGGMSRTAFVPC